MQSKSSKTMIMILAVLAAMFFGYMAIFSGGDEGEDVSGEVAPAEDAGMEAVALVNKLRNLKMDGSIFTSAEFQALRDMTREIDPEDYGRANPFAPLGQGAGAKSSKPEASIAASTSTSATTTRPGAQVR